MTNLEEEEGARQTSGGQKGKELGEPLGTWAVTAGTTYTAGDKRCYLAVTFR